MALQIYNTLTRRKEPFEPLEDKVVRMYVCGVTVYDSAHIGHAMSSLVFDTIRRYLEHRGYKVKYLQNFTDVDDKIIARARALGVSPHELADRYAREFLEEMKALNVKEADLYPRATAEIPAIIEMIQGLIDKGYAYASDGNVYFRVQKLPEYGKLSGRTLEGAAQPGEPVEGKEHPMDFALWKAAKLDEPSWKSPWGEGRPGWHIECSAMNLHHLGEQIDIHGGGMDLIFPHHENEIAQTEAYTGKPFARYWVHNGLLKLGEEKMSKSLGNLITIREFLEKHDPQALRLFVLSSGYRRPATYTEESIAAAERGLERLRSALRPANPGKDEPDPEAVAALKAQVEATRQGFYQAMDDDFSTPQALAHIFELVKAINTARDQGVSGKPFEHAQETLLALTEVLGFDLGKETEVEGVAARPFIELLVEVRAQLRADRQWELADRIRDRLAELGVILEDTPQGTEWRVV